MASDWPRTILQPGCFCLAFLLTRFGNQEAQYHPVEYGDYIDDMGDGIMDTAWHYVSR